MCARIKLSTNVSADMFSLNIVRGAVPRELVTHVEHKNVLLGRAAPSFYGPFLIWIRDHPKGRRIQAPRENYSGITLPRHLVVGRAPSWTGWSQGRPTPRGNYK